jgi:hypothetical protein
MNNALPILQCGTTTFRKFRSRFAVRKGFIEIAAFIADATRFMLFRINIHIRPSISEKSPDYTIFHGEHPIKVGENRQLAH